MPLQHPQPRQFLLPDLLAIVPLEGYTNPHYQTARGESSAWINSYNVFTDRKRAEFVQGVNELLVSHTYPFADYEQFRTVCDFINTLFVVDEVSDEQDGKDARGTGYTYLNALRDPNCADSSKLARITKDFRARYRPGAGPGSWARFVKHSEDYIEAVAIEAELRERGEVLDIDAFIDLRRDNSAIYLCFDLFEYCLGIDLPEEVFEDATFQQLYYAAADWVCWANDVYSYNSEQSKGLDGNNIVSVLMRHKNMSLQEACDYVGVYCQDLMDRYMSAKANLPSFGSPEVDEAVARYAECCGHWIKGNLDWSFETVRYFGPAVSEIKKTRVVTLLRPVKPEDFDSDTSSECD